MDENCFFFNLQMIPVINLVQVHSRVTLCERGHLFAKQRSTQASTRLDLQKGGGWTDAAEMEPISSAPSGRKYCILRLHFLLISIHMKSFQGPLFYFLLPFTLIITGELFVCADWHSKKKKHPNFNVIPMQFRHSSIWVRMDRKG